MKRVQAVIRPERLDAVQDALANGGFDGFMVFDIRGHGTEESPSGEWRGVAYAMSVRHKLMIDVLVEDDEVPAITQLLRQAATTGERGDGMIFLMEVAGVIPLHVE